MTDSIIQQSKNSKSWKRYVVIAIVILFLLWLFFFLRGNSKDESTQSSEPEIIEVTKGDILVSVEGEGKIINPNIVNLSFLINGTLQGVNVEEGEMVSKGDVIATLDPRDYNFDLRDAQNQVNIAWANIKAKEAELTDQQLRLAKDDLINSQQSLENSIRNFEQALEQSYDSANVVLERTFPELESGLRSVDEIFSFDRQISPYAIVLDSFNDSARENRIRNMYNEVKRNRDTLWREIDRPESLDSTEIIRYLRETKTVAKQMQNLLEQTLLLFDGAVPSSRVSQSLIDSAESSVSSALSGVSGEISSLTSSEQSIADAQLNQRNGIIDAERSLESTNLKLSNTERDFDRSEISKQTSLQIQYAQLAQAQVRVEKALYNLSLTKLVAPIDGEATVVNGKPGETIKADTANAENAFVRIISDDNFTTEVYIEEVDIARITKGQTAIITLDAIPDVSLEGQVTYVSNVSTIDGNGVTTYLVRVEIVDTQEAPIREGMTSYVEFVEHQALDALMVPSGAIVNDGMVFDENGERIRVRVGITDGRMTEIYEGVTEGQKILSRPPGDARGTREETGGRPQGGRGGGDMSADERMEMIGERLKENGMLPDGWGGMSTEQKQKALEAMREAQGGGGFGGGATRGPGGGTRGGGR